MSLQGENLGSSPPSQHQIQMSTSQYLMNNSSSIHLRIELYLILYSC